ncbi:MAG: acetolactate synthase small subunit [Clostridiaceae bacterium]|nr:acetolactate synthase small subunit [Clostridiaceae bacterium]
MSGQKEKIIISVWVEDRAGVLGHVTQLFGEQNCNIESLAVGQTEKNGISRMTIIIDGSRQDAAAVMSRLNRITNLIQVKQIDTNESVQMELALIQVDAPEERRTDLINLINVFRARIVDVASASMTIAIAGNSIKIDALIDLLRTFGINEIVRTGTVALDRGRKLLD